MRQVSDHNIRAVRFSAYEPDALVTCGRDNVRTHRLRHGQLRGLTVRTTAPGRQVRMLCD